MELSKEQNKQTQLYQSMKTNIITNLQLAYQTLATVPNMMSSLTDEQKESLEKKLEGEILETFNGAMEYAEELLEDMADEVRKEIGVKTFAEQKAEAEKLMEEYRQKEAEVEEKLQAEQNKSAEQQEAVDPEPVDTQPEDSKEEK
tara:strand:- start:21645 stop:22079 length:435 start_codon:yes stop_codon:yes gene_type:complete